MKFIKNLRIKIMRARYGKRVAEQCQSCGYNLTVNAPSIVTSNTVLGNNVNFNGLKIYGRGKVSIGDNFHSGSNIVLLTDIHNYEGNAIPYDNTVISKNIFIGDNVWIGYSVIVLGGAHIEEGAIIQAGSVVTGRIEKCGVAGGNPARVFKTRDVQHYEELKASGKFH